MKSSSVDAIVHAVLYEGSTLYPYRASAIKNQQPWNFGVLHPQGGFEPSSMTTECLVRGNASTRVDVDVRFIQILSGVFRFHVGISNLTPITAADAICSCMVSTHTILTVRGGEFVSLLDPPDELRDAAAGCSNIGTWPVLVGREPERDYMLSSPIILYDYPQIALESPGDLFDGTEIDELLTLRILTLTESEKAEIRRGDERSKRILERAESLTPEQLRRLHGTMRDKRSISPTLRRGGRVRLHPRPGGDMFDIVLAGRTAIIESVEQDLEDRIHVAVVIEDDPGQELWWMRQPGHRFFFSAEEVEPIS